MTMKLSHQKIEEMRNLRQHGYSLAEISSLLHIAKSTTSHYVSSIQVLPDYKEILTKKRNSSTKVKLLKEQKAFDEAQKLVKNLSRKEKMLFLAALYWAEGNKKDFSLSNTDPYLIKVFVECMRDIFDIPENKFRVSVRIYEDLDKETCLSFWSKVTDIPKEKFVNVNVLQGKKIGKLQYGMCRVRITKGGDILKKLMAINKTVANKFV